MPRSYTRKTNRGNVPLDTMERAADTVAKGYSVRSTALQFNIPLATLQRYLKKKAADNNAVTGYAVITSRQLIFNPQMEADLAAHIKALSDQYHGLSPDKVRVLALEFALLNGIVVPTSWIANGKAGREWLSAFSQRNHLSLRKPEATSLARATAFNKHNVGQFFDKLAALYDR